MTKKPTAEAPQAATKGPATADEPPQAARDWSETLFLPKTDFPMKAGLPEREPEWVKRWQALKVFQTQRAQSKGREKFVLHDGPPYANGNIHIGTGLNKILKDVVVRSQQMLGKDANYVPGWDCHGLPIEWKIEEKYREAGKDKDKVGILEFRKECREFAQHWLNVQREEFMRLGVEGDWWHPYMTMTHEAEAHIAAELMKFAMNGLLYRGSKPVMWSVVEKTALAEAEVEYQDYQSDTIFVKFPVQGPNLIAPLGSPDKPGKSMPVWAKTRAKYQHASIVIWTTTPWTIPGNRAIAFSPKIAYGLFEVTKAADGNWAKVGDQYIVADKLASAVMKSAKIEADGFEKLDAVGVEELAMLVCHHPIGGSHYAFPVPLLAGDHVTDDTGTGFVHTAPSHGTDDFEVWMAHSAELEKRKIDTRIPFTVDENGVLTKEAPGFEGKRVLTDKGDKGDANDAVIKALAEAGALIARGRLKHQYPHSWRSKKPVIFRNTPQWFIAMDRGFGLGAGGAGSVPSPRSSRGEGQGEGRQQTVLAAKTSPGSTKKTSVAGFEQAAAPHPNPLPVSTGGGKTLRDLALKAIDDTTFSPPAGQNRLRGMIEAKPDWVLSRQRAWGVPIAVFFHKETLEVIPNAKWKHSAELIKRITDSFTKDGADAWYKPGAAEAYLKGLVDQPVDWQKVDDILDVWFESGCTHAFCLEQRPDLKWPADLYLEGSDQHRGWFHSSLLESCGTRGRAPYDQVLTHGFVMAEDGRKMSKSLGNTVTPQDVMKTYGADILRLWVMSSDYSEDLRIGKDILKANAESYRKIRITWRWLLGNLAHYDQAKKVEHKKLPELERLMLHMLAELNTVVREGYAAYDFKRVFQALSNFCIVDLSAFYFDIRKDTLYCEPEDSADRQACLTVLDRILDCLTIWLAPMLCFTAEETWLARHPSDTDSVHYQTAPEIPNTWTDKKLAEKWEGVRTIRKAVTGALELERAAKRIGSSLEAAPVVTIDDPEIAAYLKGIDLAELCITSGAELKVGAIPEGAFRHDEARHVGVVVALAKGKKCERSWRITEDVGTDKDYPTLSARDAKAARQWDARHGK